MQRRATLPVQTHASTVIAVLFIFAAVIAECSIPYGAECSTNCIAEQCDTLGIRYGKYCGVGYTGCPGQMPCDDLDACCQGHDECVDKFGMTHVKCHEKLKRCLRRVHKSGKVGFSKVCPIETAAPTMIRGMDYAILLSKLDRSADL